MSHKVEIYLDKNKDEELQIVIPRDEMKHAVELLGPEYIGHTPICDWCGKKSDKFYFFPELGHKVSCPNDAKEHRKIVKWYVEDLHTVFNSLISFVLNYDLGWTDEDFDTIDRFFESKDHNEIHIRNFIGGKHE